MNKRVYVGILSVLMTGAIALTGCGQSQATSGSSTTPASSQKLRALTAGGSTALQPLLEEAAKEYEQKNGNSVNVQGGGSGTGLSQVAAGTFDLGDSDIFAEEKSGVNASQLVDHQVAVVGMGPVVNPQTGVKNITKQQLMDIFTGKVTNWKEVGGADQKIVIINRSKGSGTRATFEKYGIGTTDEVNAQEQDSSGTVRQMVAQTPGAISYLAFSYFDSSVQALSLDGVAPTANNVTTGKWPIWSYEHVYTKGQPDASEKAFLDYLMSPDVQNGLVTKMGYIAGTAMKVQRDVNGKVTNK